MVALFGATALGKSDVALELAGSLGADILVADSMQAYAGLPILTNQPGAEARSRARYHLVAWATPQEEVSVARFSRRAHTVVDELLAGGTPVVVEGGSGLYLRAVLGDLDFGSPPDEARRHVLEDLWRRAPEELVAELRARAPDVAARIDLQNGRRVIRALESLDVRPAQTDRLWSGEGRYAYRLFALDPGHDRAALETRIDRRVDDMLARGALEEVAAARAAGPLSRTAVQAIGVRELCAVLDGELSPAEAATRMKTRTRALARRQLTWMRKLPDAVRIPVAGRSPEVVGGDVLSLIG